MHSMYYRSDTLVSILDVVAFRPLISLPGGESIDMIDENEKFWLTISFLGFIEW